MSATYTQWCKTHGEWDMDIDNPSECPECIRLGLTEVQQLKQRIEVMRQTLDDQVMVLEEAQKKLADWAEHQDMAPHRDCQCNYCVTLDELARLKEAFVRLREDRDQILSEYNKLGGSH